MATRLKTVKYAFSTLASLPENSNTNMTQLTINLPENSKVFKSVVAHITFDDLNTSTGDTITNKNFGLRLGAAAYTTVSNSNTLTASGENMSLWFAVDYTSHFTTNWTGTSMTCDFQAQVNSGTNNVNFANVSVTLDITYEYDDTSATHIKTVMIPLDMPTGAMDTAATTRDTIPALDTYLPEASKTYRNIHVVVQGNTANASATTDHTMTLRVGAASVTTGNYEGSLASDRIFRYVWNATSVWPSTAATQTWQPTATVARVNHAQAWVVVTYEFNPSTSTSIMNSLMMPMELASPMGGTTATDYQSGDRQLWIEEPGTITTNRVAFYCFWQQAGAITGLNMRVGTGAFVAYTDAAAVLCGANCAMVRNDAAFTLARGLNDLTFDVYRTDTADYGWNLCGFWIVNYTSGKATQGVGAHNHTIDWGIVQNGTGAAADLVTTTALAPVVPETEHFFTALGVQMITTTSGTLNPAGFTILAERLAAEGGTRWEQVYIDVSQTDPEVGFFPVYAQMRFLFNRWPSDPDPYRIDLEQTRRWRAHIAGGSGWFSLCMTFTYHSITRAIAGTVSGYADADGAGLTVRFFYFDPGGHIEYIGSTTTATGGAYSFTWYDDVYNVFAVVHEDSTHVGSSALGTAT